MRQEDRATLGELREATLEVLAEVVGRGRTVALLDAPNQRNVGDSMIWAGEVEYFRALGLQVCYVADLRCYDARALRRVLPDDGVILVHGGGNVGDIWPGHQLHREQIAADFPDRRIVQLPQSVWFASTERAREADERLGRHPDLLLLVRDAESEQRAARDLPSVRRRYCWDMALGWTPPAAAPPRHASDVLVLARTDSEGASGLGGIDLQQALGRPVEVQDWTDPALDTLGWRLARLVPRLAVRVGPLRRSALYRPLLRASFTWINRANLQGGLALLRGRRLVLLDRLHAHVLAVLLGIDHVLLDNNYRKLGAVHDDYTHRFNTVTYARDADELTTAAAALLRAS